MSDTKPIADTVTHADLRERGWTPKQITRHLQEARIFIGSDRRITSLLWQTPS